jgi:hypothetical protein
MSKSKTIALLLAGSLCVSAAYGQTVAWGTSVNFTPLSFNSDGTQDTGINTWSIGWFNDGFIPDPSNYLEWAANYNVVSSLTPEVDPLDAGGGTLINYPIHREDSGLWATSVNTFDVGAAAAGKQIYMFAWNDLGLIGTPQGEALLYREDGLFLPSTPNQISFDIADNLLDPVDDDFTVIWGQVDRRIDVIDPDSVLRGGGVISAPLTDSTQTGFFFAEWEAQFATWPIPEPSSALLVLFGTMGLTLRRKR